MPDSARSRPVIPKVSTILPARRGRAARRRRSSAWGRPPWPRHRHDQRRHDVPDDHRLRRLGRLRRGGDRDERLLVRPAAGAGRPVQPHDRCRLTILRNEISADSGSTIEPNRPVQPGRDADLPAAGLDRPGPGPALVRPADQGGLRGHQRVRRRLERPGVHEDQRLDRQRRRGVRRRRRDLLQRRLACRRTRTTWCSTPRTTRPPAIPLTYIGPENEANLSTSYDSMQLSPAQTANILDVLGPTMASSGLSTKVECCATEGWDYAQQYAAAIEADPTAQRGHARSSPATATPRRRPRRCPAGPSRPGRPSGPRSRPGTRPGTTAPTPPA